jgi:hypothetical protein
MFQRAEEWRIFSTDSLTIFTGINNFIATDLVMTGEKTL